MNQVADIEQKAQEAKNNFFQNMSLDQQGHALEQLQGAFGVFQNILKSLFGDFEGFDDIFGDMFKMNKIEAVHGSVELVKTEINELVEVSKGLQDTGDLNIKNLEGPLREMAGDLGIKDVDGFIKHAEEHFKNTDMSEFDLANLESELMKIPEIKDAAGNAVQPIAAARALPSGEGVNHSIGVEVSKENFAQTFHLNDNVLETQKVGADGNFKMTGDVITVDQLFENLGDKVTARMELDENGKSTGTVSFSSADGNGRGYSVNITEEADFAKIDPEIMKDFETKFEPREPVQTVDLAPQPMAQTGYKAPQASTDLNNLQPNMNGGMGG